MCHEKDVKNHSVDTNAMFYRPHLWIVAHWNLGGFTFQATLGTRFFFASFGQSFFEWSGQPQLKQACLEELLIDEVEAGFVEVLSLLPGFLPLRAADTCF